MIRVRKYCQCGCVIYVWDKGCLFFETERDDAKAIGQCYNCHRLLDTPGDVFTAVELLPVMRIFDLGDVGGERFTICFEGDSVALSLSINPESPLGISQCCETVIGPHLGKEILFVALPQHIQDHIVRRYQDG